MNKTSIRLKEILEQKGIKQIELARQTGIDKGQLNSYLSGRYKPKQDKIYLLAYALNINPDWLNGLDVSMELTSDKSTGQTVFALDHHNLSSDEEELIELYRNLAAESKAEVRGFIKGISYAQQM